jgi:hypothetical protein
MDRKVMNFFEKICLKRLLWHKILASLMPKSLGHFFLEKISPNALKFRPNGEISPYLVTLIVNNEGAGLPDTKIKLCLKITKYNKYAVYGRQGD